MIESRPVPPTPSGPTRRQVLRGGATAVAGVGVAAVVGGCAGGDERSNSGPRTLDQPISVAKDEIPVGNGVIKPDDRVVVTQPATGEFHAFSAVCTHQGCLVSLIRNDAIVCACHSSLFALTDGSVLSGPAPAGLPALRVTDDGDHVRVG